MRKGKMTSRLQRNSCLLGKAPEKKLNNVALSRHFQDTCIPLQSPGGTGAHQEVNRYTLCIAYANTRGINLTGRLQRDSRNLEITIESLGIIAS